VAVVTSVAVAELPAAPVLSLAEVLPAQQARLPSVLSPAHLLEQPELLGRPELRQAPRLRPDVEQLAAGLAA